MTTRSANSGIRADTPAAAGFDRFPAERARWVVMAGMALAGAVTFAFRWLSLTDLTNDHFDHVARARQVLIGDWPVGDFVDPGLPLTYMLSAVVNAIVGSPFLAEALLFAGGFAVAAALTWRLSLLASGSFVIAAIAVVLQAAAYPRSYGYPKLLVYAIAITVGWWAVRRPRGHDAAAASSPRAFGVGRLAGLAAATAVAYYFRHDHGVYVGIGAIVLLAVDGRHGGVRALVRTLAVYSALTLAFLLPHLAYVQWQIGLATYLAVAAEYSRMETAINPYRFPGFQWQWGVDTAVALVFWSCWVMPVAAAALLLRRRVSTPLPNEASRMAMVVALAFCVNLGLLRDPLVARLPDVAVPHSLLGAWLLAALWRLPRAGATRLMTRTVLVMSTVLLAAAVFTAFETAERVSRTRVADGPAAVARRWSAVTSDLLSDYPSVLSSATEPLAPFLEYVRECTSLDDRLLYVGYQPEIYVIANRGFAGGHMMFLGGFHSSPEEQALTVGRLAEQQVPFVLVPAAERAGFERSFPQVAGYVEARYRPLTSVDMDGSSVDILVDASRVSGAPAPGEWPCPLPPP